jgi:predicted MPP superfamily phosphohydrolase
MTAGLAELYETFVPGYREGMPRADDGVPILTPELLNKIRNARASDPQGTLERARRAIRGGLSPDELDRVIRHLDQVFRDPEGAIRDAMARGMVVPAKFKFAGFDDGNDYRFEPDSKRFSDDDWTGFGLNCGSAILKRWFTGNSAFRWHTTYESTFRYDLTPNASIALFSDFGTGLAHSRYIAKFIAARKPDLAIHLGDVYYSGRPPEVASFYDKPLASLVSSCELWSIPGNHDYFSGGGPFFEGLDARRNRAGGCKHRQEGSYFCLDSKSFRIIAIDGEYHSGTRYENDALKSWMAHSIADAKSAGRAVILMSSDEPYSYDSKTEATLLHDVTANLPPDAIDLWFWGNTHYCALFDASARLRPQFYGSCIGHGGYQYKTLDHQSGPDDVAQILWAEREPRFPRWTAVRSDMGNNGFCMMKLDDDARSVTLDYTDWTNAPRATVKFTTVAKRLEMTELRPHPRPDCK